MEDLNTNELPKDVMQVKMENENSDKNQGEHSTDVDNLDLSQDSTHESSHSMQPANGKKLEVAVPSGNGIELFSIVEIEDTNLKKETQEDQVLQKNQCRICKKIFRGKCLLEIHMRVHTGEKPFNCTLCGKDFRQKAALKTHLLSHTRIKPYKCGQCDRAFATEKDLKAHSLTHSTERPFFCDICQRSFISEKTLKYHRARHTRGYPFPCDVCEMRFCYLHLLRRHQLTHTGEKPFKCKYCDKSFRQKHESVVHMQTHPENADNVSPSLETVLEIINSIPAEGETIEAKEAQSKISVTNPPRENQLDEHSSSGVMVESSNDGEEKISTVFEDNSISQKDTSLNDFVKIEVKQEPLEPTVKKFVCKCCGANFALQNTLSHHIRQKMCSVQHSTCPICQKVFTSKETLEAHILTHTQCDICGKSFENSEQIEVHKAEEHNLKIKHPCPHPDCNKAFYKGGQLEKHIETHNIKKEFQCQQCDKSFNRKFYLTQHMNRHNKTRPFKCEQCAKAFYSAGELQRHIMRHTGDRPFACDMCDKSYPLASELRVHKVSHSGERPFACEFCPMRFGFANVLRKHLLTHTGERSYKCTVCQRGFVHKQNCEDHIKTHSGEKSHVCKVCGAQYYTKDSLRKHMKNHNKFQTIDEDEVSEFL